MWEKWLEALPARDAEVLRELAVEQVAMLVVRELLKGEGQIVDSEEGGVLLQGVDEEGGTA